MSGAISALVESPAFLSIGGIAGNGSVATEIAIRTVDLSDKPYVSHRAVNSLANGIMAEPGAWKLPGGWAGLCCTKLGVSGLPLSPYGLILRAL